MPARSFRAGIKPMSARRAAVYIAAGLFTVSCSEKPAPLEPQTEVGEKENEEQPREDKIAEDCVTFLQATKVVPQAPAADCPGCAGEGSQVLAFRQMQVDRMSCAANSCEITVTLQAVFNSGPAGTISGGLTGWIPQEQRLQYLNGHPPEGDQFYRVKIIYKRTGQAWRAIEFDKADPQ
jgi:hypothetical protein